jgi:hypothetical protein
MVTWQSVEAQLKQTGCHYLLWGYTESRELPHILMDGEKILQAVNGYYDGGFAMLIVTNFRVLIVDKKPFLLTVEDLRYDMIAEVDYSARIITSVLHVFTPMRTLAFTSWSRDRLRNCMSYIQQRVMELRNNEYLSNQFTQNQFQLQRVRGQLAPQGKQEYHQISQMIPTRKHDENPVAYFEDLPHTPQHHSSVKNPYTKVPLLARRRRYPSFY